MVQLKGKRLTLRPLRLSDAPHIYENVKEEKLTRYTRMPYPYPKKLALQFVKESVQQWKKKTDCAFGIFLNKTFVGMIGLHKIEKRDKHAELGYWVAVSHWGKGIASEAVNLTIDYGFHKLKLNRIYATVYAPNVSSGRVLEKSGFVKEGTMRQFALRKEGWLDAHIYSKLRYEHAK